MHISPLVPAVLMGDSDGKLAYDIAKYLAPPGVTLDAGDPVPEHSIVFFGSSVGHFGDRCFRTNPESFERYGIEEPEWVRGARYRIAVRGKKLWTAKDKFLAGLPEAVRCVLLHCNRLERKRQGLKRWSGTIGIISPIPRGLPSEVAA